MSSTIYTKLDELTLRALQKREPDRRLYLAVSRNTFETLFQEEAGQLLLEEPDFRMIVFDFISSDGYQYLFNAVSVLKRDRWDVAF